MINQTQTVRCPNCGSHAQRNYYANNQTIETTCPTCDYLMVSCSQTGKVLESYYLMPLASATPEISDRFVYQSN